MPFAVSSTVRRRISYCAKCPTRSPDAGEVVVRIEGASVNFPDTLFIQNKYQISVPVPFTPGSEFVGKP